MNTSHFKRLKCLCFTLCLLNLSLSSGLANRDSAVSGRLSTKPVASIIDIGWGKVEITPPIGTPLAGFGKRKGKPSQGIHDSLYSRAIWFNSENRHLVIVSVDLVLIDAPLRKAVLKKIRQKIPLNDSELILTATHTHSGAGAIGKRFWERFIMGRYQKSVFESVSAGIAKSVLDARASLEPAVLEITKADISDLVENRMDARIRVPHEMKVLRMISPQNFRVIAHLIFMAVHPTILPASNMDFSADFPGELNRFLEKDHPNSLSLFINGAAGDLRPKTSSYPTRLQTMEAYGFNLANKIKSLSYQTIPLTNLWKTESINASLPNTKIRLGKFHIPFLIGNRFFPTRSLFTAARIGPLLFLSAPGELDSETGCSIETLAEARGFTPFLAGYANDYTAYVVPKRFYKDQSQYESRVSFYGPNMSRFVENKLDQLTLRLMTEEEKSLINPEGIRSGTEKLPVLSLNGDFYHVGFEEGRLLRNEIRSEIDSIFRYLRSELKIPGINRLLIHYALTRAWRQMDPYISYQEYQQMKGIADGAGVSFSKIKQMHALPEVFPSFCANSAFWGDATQDGRLIAIRNLDWNRKIGVHNHAAVKFIHIPGQKKYVNIGYQGFTGVLSGMNEAGISVGQIGSSSVDETMRGVPMPFLLKRVLETSGSLDEIKTIMETTDRTRGYNFIFADAVRKEAMTVESTQHHLSFFRDADLREKEVSYAFPLRSCVLRSDTAIDPVIRDLQLASKGNPKKPGLEPPAGSAYEIRYKKHAELIQKNFGSITPESAKKIAREIAPGSNIQSVIYAFPEFYVANAEGNKRAVDDEYTHFDFESQVT